MKNLSKENFFFFSNDCSEFEIKPNSLCHAYLAILNDDLDEFLEDLNKTNKK